MVKYSVESNIERPFHQGTEGAVEYSVSLSFGLGYPHAYDLAAMF